MKEIREKMRREHHEDTRFIADQSQMKYKVITGESTYEKQRRESAFKTEMVYSSDLQSVLSLFDRCMSEERENQAMLGVANLQPNYDFYFACLDRIDMLVTEKGSPVGRQEVLEILRRLSYFRPKEALITGKISKAMGEFTKKENQDDVISTRHKEIMSS